MTNMNRLQQKYQDQAAPAVMKELGIKNKLAVPRPEKVAVSTSFYEKEHQDEAIKQAGEWMALITGQKPAVTRAKKSIAAFNLREGAAIGLRATLRGSRMWDFLDKLISVVLPQVKDFRGVSRSGFDGAGNYTMGLTEQIIFPELSYDSAGKIRGLQVTICCRPNRNEGAVRLMLEKLGVPFKKEGMKQ